MANGQTNNSTGNGDAIMVRATVILRIPDLDTNELTELYKTLREIKAKYGGEFDVTTTEQNPNQ